MNTQPVNVAVHDDSLIVNAPYNEDFVAEAKRMGGRWNGQAWRFDARDEQRVRDLCFETYGQDGIRSELCTIEVVFDPEEGCTCGPLTVYGRTIARARGRDSGATLGEGVVLLKGDFTSGGSCKNWETVTRSGATVLIRDFPKRTAVRIQEQGKRWLTRIVEEEQPHDQRASLEADKAALLARIAEIDKRLAELAA